MSLVRRRSSRTSSRSEDERQDRIRRSGGGSGIPDVGVPDRLDDLEAARPGSVEPRSHLDAGPGLHRPIVNRACREWHSGLRSSPHDRVARTRPTLRLERKCWKAGERLVCGIDEVGRGAWAGPVTVAAVIPAPGAPAAASATRRCSRRDQREVAATGGARRGRRAYRHRPCEPRRVRHAGHDRGAAHRRRARARPARRRRASSPTA